MAKNAEELAEPAEVDLPPRVSENIQGNILAPFNKPYQRFLFISFMNRPQQARDWLRDLVRGGVASTSQVVEHNEAYKRATEEEGTPPAAVGRGELHVLRAADPGSRPGERPAGLRRLPAGPARRPRVPRSAKDVARSRGRRPPRRPEALGRGRPGPVPR